MHTKYERAIETDLLYGTLREVKPNKSISYADLSELIGADVQKNNARGYLYTARRLCETDHDIVFEVVRNVGLKRIVNDDVMGVAESAFSSIRRKAGKTIKTIKTVNYKALSNEGKTKHNASITLMGTISLFSKKRSQLLLEDKARETGKALPLGKTLELFKK